MADWLSLPSELVACIADCLLATNDLDCYMDFRAVCTAWRSSTDDPKNSSDLRFRPRRWIIIDEVFESDSRLLVNTLSGRVVRKDLPLLRRFYVVSTMHGGFIVLAEKKDPHAERDLNPFTGHLIHFMAPLPYLDVSAAVIGSLPTIVLLDDSKGHCMQFVGDPGSECCTLHVDDHYRDTYPMNRLAFLGGVYGDGEYSNGDERPVAPIPDGADGKISTLFPSISLADCCSIAEFAGQVFVILNLHHQNQMAVLKLDTVSQVLEPVNSISNLAIFVGRHRCFTVNADKFPSIGAGCIYYVKSTDSHVHIYKYNLKEGKEEVVSEAIGSFVPPLSFSGTHRRWDSVSRATSFSMTTTPPPFTLIQLLSSYTTKRTAI